MTTKERFSWKKRGRSFGYAGKGTLTLVREEHNAWIHCAVAVCVIIAAAIFDCSAAEWCLIIICIGGVLSAEAVNSAVEALADKISPCDDPTLGKSSAGFDPMIGKAKDLAAGAVLLAAIAAVAVGLIIFIPKVVNLLSC